MWKKLIDVGSCFGKIGELQRYGAANSAAADLQSLVMIASQLPVLSLDKDDSFSMMTSNIAQICGC
jgi:hypothetical protein